MVAPTERRARSAMRSDHGKPISRCCAVDSSPSATALTYSGACTSASSPSLAGSASRTRIAGSSRSTASRSRRYLLIGKLWPGGSASVKWSEWKASIGSRC